MTPEQRIAVVKAARDAGLIKKSDSVTDEDLFHILDAYSKHLAELSGVSHDNIVAFCNTMRPKPAARN